MSCDKKTALHIACEYGYFDIAKLLIWGGADKGVKDVHGRTPYQFACHMYADSSFIKLIK